MKKIVIATVILGVTGVIVYLALPARPVTGPPAHPWASFPPGAWVLRRETAKLGGKDMVSTIRTEVLQSTAKEVRIRVTTTHADGSTDSQEQTVGTEDEDYSRTGFEMKRVTPLQVDNETITCMIFEKGETVRWFSDRAPAWPVLETIKIEGERVETRLVHLTRRLTIAGKTIDCPVYLETRPHGNAHVWKSNRVPGHIVQRIENQANDVSIRLEIIDFDAKRP